MIDPFNLDPQLGVGSDLKVLRQSTLGSADVCHRRVMYDLDPSVPYGSGAARAIGTAYHAVLEDFYRCGEVPSVEGIEKIVRASLTDEVNRTGDAFAWDADVAPTFEVAVRKAVHMASTYFDREYYWPVGHRSDWEVLAVEETLLLPLTEEVNAAGRPANGWVMKGTLDLVLRDPHGWHVIVDHKTAKKKWRKDKHTTRKTNQPAWYSHWWPRAWAAEHGGELPNVHFVFDVMTYDGDFERRPAPVRPIDIDVVTGKAELLSRLVENDGPWLPNTDSFLCSERYCDHWERCPFGAAWNKG